jgi:hypothetical protein
MMLRLGIATALVGLIALTARAEHADIDLKVTALGQSDGSEAHASADQEPPAGGYNPRPLFHARAGQPLALQFILTSTYPHGEKKNVTVRYYVVREAKAGQKTVPDPRAAVPRGRFVLNLKPGGRVGARVIFRLREPGVYLLRVDTQNTDSDHEHFAAIDVKVD